MPEDDNLSKIAQHDAAIESLTKGQDQLRTDIHNLEGKLDRGISSIFSKIDGISQSSRPDVKGLLLGIVATIGLLMTMLGLFVKLTVDPLTRELKDSRFKADEIRLEVIENAKLLARHQGGAVVRDEWHNAWLAMHEKSIRESCRDSTTVVDRVGALESQLEAFGRQLNAVDSAGSRRWNKSKSEP